VGSSIPQSQRLNMQTCLVIKVQLGVVFLCCGSCHKYLPNDTGIFYYETKKRNVKAKLGVAQPILFEYITSIWEGLVQWMPTWAD